MIDAVERLVNLALLLASTPRPVTADECRRNVFGYEADQDDVAFIRMFERDKDALRAAGLVIAVTSEGETEAYRLDAHATYAAALELDGSEIAAIHAVAAALATDATFPFREDLALAVGKIAAESAHAPALATTLPAGEPDGAVSLHARALAEAVHARKTVTFDYMNATGDTRGRAVDPYGVFFREGDWYLTGRDRDTDKIRTYTIARMSDLDVNPMRPKSPDFERPDSFDVRDYERLPFQLGNTITTARIRFEPEVAWRAESLTRGRGDVEALPDGSIVWAVDVADLGWLASWLVDEGPGLHPVDPPELITALSDGLRKVVARHA